MTGALLSGPWKWRIVLAAFLLACLGFNLITAERAAREISRDPHSLLAPSGAPWPVNSDGYYFLRLARDLSRGAYLLQDELRGTQRPEPPPPISLLTSALQRLTRLDPAAVAFYLPPLLAWLLVPVLAAWGAALNSRIASLAAPLAAALSPYMPHRTGPGFFDTDCLIPPLLFFSAWLGFKAVESAGKRWKYAAGFLACAAASWWWWRPAGPLCLAMALGPALFLARPAGTRKRFVPIAGAVILGCLCFLIIWPEWAGRALDHLKLALGLGRDASITARSVVELRGFSLNELARQSLGGWAGFAAALAGIGALFLSRPKTLLVLWPLLLCGPGALLSRRLAVLFIPLACIGFGLFLDRLSRFKGERAWKQWLAALLALVLIAPAAARLWERPVRQIFTRSEARLAAALARGSSPHGLVWLWWDHGYFTQYAAERKTFFDGGLQTPANMFAAAFPLACEDPELARNWMHFFGYRGVEALDRLARMLGGRDKALAFLKSGLSGQTPLHELEQKYDLAWLDMELETFLFPKIELYLFLPKNLLKTNGYWFGFGREKALAAGPENHIQIYPKSGVKMEIKGDDIVFSGPNLPRYFDNIGSVAMSSPAPLPPGLFDDNPDPFVILPREGADIYFVDKAMAKTLAFGLLAGLGPPPEGFKTIFFHPDVGGVWKVE